jgi:hypothetical protein
LPVGNVYGSVSRMAQESDDHRPGCQLNPCSCKELAEHTERLQRLDAALTRRRETVLAYYELLRSKGHEADVRRAAIAARDADIELMLATTAMTEAAL